MKIHNKSSVVGVLLVALMALSYLLYLQRRDAGLGGYLTRGEGGEAYATLPGPHPSLDPQQVVLTILTALRDNDAPRPDAGIDTTFRFASPANRMLTGPLARFRDMVKQPIYAPMMAHGSASITGLQVRGRRALVRVELSGGALPEPAVFDFMLSRQQDAPYAECWMTDGVQRLAPESVIAPAPPESGGGHI